MIWKNKDSDLDMVCAYPCVHVLFRNISRKILKPRVEDSTPPPNLVQGVFQHVRPSLDLVFSLDPVLKEQAREKLPYFRAFWISGGL